MIQEKIAEVMKTDRTTAVSAKKLEMNEFYKKSRRTEKIFRKVKGTEIYK